MKKYFPIQTGTSCRSKWSWSTLYLNLGETASCHRASRSPIPEDFDSFHNTDRKLKDRETMLQGKWPGNGCEHCEIFERSGTVSDRMFQNTVPNIYPEELDSDPTRIKVDPVVLELQFSNLCNLGCVYCGPACSSFIQQEAIRFGGNLSEPHRFVTVNTHREYSEKFFNWFDQHGHKLKRLQLIGGEPLLQPEVQRLIDVIIHQRFPDLELNIISNFSIPRSRTFPILDKLADAVIQKRLHRVDINTSIDCWGASQIYARHGIDLELFEMNMQHLLSLGVFRVGIMSTVNSLSISAMPELMIQWQRWNQKQRVHWYLNLIQPSGRTIFTPEIFEYKNFQSSFKQILNSLPDDADDWDNQSLRQSLSSLNDLFKIRCHNNIDGQLKLLNFFRQNDHRRNLESEKVFPWIYDIFRQNHVV